MIIINQKVFAKNLLSQEEIEVYPADRYTLQIMNHDYWFERDGHVCLLAKTFVKPDRSNSYSMYQAGNQIYDATWTNSYEELKSIYNEQPRLF